MVPLAHDGRMRLWTSSMGRQVATFAHVRPLGDLGSKCREAADRLVGDLLANPNDRTARAGFTRSLGFFILDSYRLNGWEHYER